MSEERAANETIASFDVRSFFKRWPFFYYTIAVIFGPLMYGGVSVRRFVKQHPTNGKILNIGSGPRVIDPQIVNVDIHPYPGVSLLIEEDGKVPLADGTVSQVISETVLEHVKGPEASVKEIYRLLSDGGLVYATIPFLYPYHSSPSDYKRWTMSGILELFEEFEIVEIGVRAGPFSALTVYLNHLFSVIFSFGSKRLASLLLNLVMFVTFPIKLLDLIFNHWPNAEEVSAVFYLIARKK